MGAEGISVLLGNPTSIAITVPNNKFKMLEGIPSLIILDMAQAMAHNFSLLENAFELGITPDLIDAARKKHEERTGLKLT